MKKKKIYIIVMAVFILCAGCFYTVTYLRPWKKDILLDDSITSEQSLADKDGAQSLTPAEEKEDVSPNETSERTKYVHICGEVRNPGVYEVADDTRLNDAVNLAGGLTKKAAAECVNLAEMVEDGRQYYIPSKKEVKEKQFQAVTSVSTAKADENRGNAGININTASKEELMTLSGVGSAKADAIIDYRENVSRFETIEDLTKVNGIKTGLLQKIRDQVVVE